MRIEGYAVVGDDDRIADAAGQMPNALKNDAEWAFFQDGLDEADIVALGRRSHDVTPNPRRRRRLVLTRSVARAKRQGDVVFWNPAGASLEAAVEAFGCPVQHIAVAGGRDVFDFFLRPPHRYTAFHLSQIEGVKLPGGTGVFGAVETGGLTAADVLASFGYGPASTRTLETGVSVATWVPDCV